MLQTSIDRTDLVARVFHLKFKTILHDLIHEDVLGVVIGYIYVIEFQKRGLPHAHVLLIMAPHHQLHTPDDYDAVVCAELPDECTDPELFETVSR